jgi:hypothetical protein
MGASPLALACFSNDARFNAYVYVCSARLVVLGEASCLRQASKTTRRAF